ncbi:MAG: RNA pseudouridine synthase [Bdellovibrionales bacterium]|nr:RNA pseudouridine synthase [Bdellovibrionales bacterium]
MLEPVILERGANFAAIDKPAGWLSVPGRFGDGDERDRRAVAGRWLEEKLGARVWPVHRLDAEVSGLLLFALDAGTHRALQKLFEGRGIEKRYEALTSQGEAPPEGEQRWESKIVRGKRRSFEAPHGKDSITLARCLGPARAEAEAPPAHRWDLQPLTGRPHQLRFELARHGFPILGDTLYGSQTPWPPGGIALRAVSLDLGPEAPPGLPRKLCAAPLHERTIR